MSKEKEKEIIDPEIDYPEATKILNKAIKKMDKEILIEKADEQNKEKTEDTEYDKFAIDQQIKEFTTYFDLIFEFIFTIINPMLKKEKIDPISKEEINDLTQAILGYITDKLLTSSGTKITEFFSKIVDIPKLIRLIVSVWKIIFPRLTKYFESRKKPPDISGELS